MANRRACWIGLVTILIVLTAPVAAQRRVHLQVITCATEEQSAEIMAKLEAGERFEELAKALSTHPTASQGGWLGPMSPADLEPSYQEHSAQLKDGELTSFTDNSGQRVILRKLGRREAGQAYSQIALREGIRELESNQPRQAVEKFKEAVTHDGRSAEAHMYLGIAYRLLSAYDMIGEAKAEFRQALAIKPDLLRARLELAEVYIELSRLDEAQQTLQEELETSGSAYQRALLGEVNRLTGRPLVSVLHNTEALKLDPALTRARFFLAKAYLDLERTSDAIAELDSTVAAEDATAEMYLLTGIVHRESGQLDRSIELLQKAVDVEPGKPEPYLEMAVALRMAERGNDALRQLHSSLNEVRAGLKSVEIEGDPVYFQKLLTRIHQEFGFIYQSRKQLPAAEKSYRIVLRLDPNYGPAHRQLALLLLEQGKPDEAYQHALKAGDLGSALEAEQFEKIRQATAP